MFYELSGVALTDERQLVLPRAKGILRALHVQPSFHVRGVYAHANDGERLESLVADIDLSVPQDVQVDIRAVERIAICCDSRDADYPVVLALRRDFPRTAHEYGTAPGAPVALCLYDTPFDEQRLVWNPSEFLGRIQDWLEKTAIGTLHPDDQPVEPFFYATGSDVLIPSAINLDAPVGAGDWVIGRLVYRTADESGAFTCHLQVVPEQAVSELHRAGRFAPRALVITTGGQEHGIIHLMPHTLGELAQLLSPLGTDVRALLRQHLQTMVRGSTWSDADALMLVVRIPLLRHGVHASDSLAAFYFQDRLGQIGETLEATSALIGGRRQAVLMLRHDDAKADALVLEPCNAYRDSTAEAARVMSGSTANLLAGVVLGAGAIGSNVLAHLVRSGWSKLTIVDHDHLRAHNLVRHILPRRYVGRNKAIAVCEFLGDLWHGSQLVAIPKRAADATADAAFVNALKTAGVILDCSASQAAARVATLDWSSTAQRISAFLTPDGTGGALLAEPGTRDVWLDAIEAQYYRRLIREPIGAAHLTGKVAQHRYGLGCRDRTFVIAPEVIARWAALFVHSIRAAMGSPDAQVVVFESKPDGELAVHRLPVAPSRRAPYLQWTIVYDDELLRHLDALRRAKPGVETGGALLGYYDVQRKIVYVVDGLDAPPDSIEAPTHFVRGSQGLSERLETIRSQTGGMVSMIGDWHSHPPRVPATPSGDDVDLLIEEGLAMAEDGLPGLIAIIGDGDFSFVCASEIEGR